MKQNPFQFLRHNLTFLLLIALAVASSPFAFSATVSFKDGSTVKGKILSLEDGIITMETDFAGTLELKQSEVVELSTDETINLSTEDGSTFVGTVESTSEGLRVSTDGGSVVTEIEKVSAAWLPGQDSPTERSLKAEAASKERKWKYNASVDISGKSGNSDRSTFGIGAKAILESSQDRLAFYIKIDNAEENGVTTADEIKGGIDYSAFFSDSFSWYAKSELEKDEIELLDLRSTTAFGIGKHLIREEDQSLELRGGLAYRFESFQDGSEVDSPGLDLALKHSKDFSWGALNNLLTYNPSFNDFGNYRVYHESSLDLPVGAGEFWTLRLGLSNDYNSEPLPGLKEMDTTYFTRLLLKWK